MAAPRWFKPKIEILFVQSELQEQFNTVMQKHGFDALDSIHVGILLCSLLIQQYSREGLIDAEPATGLVAQSIFEAAGRCMRP
jgi:hypothetical protein